MKFVKMHGLGNDFIIVEDFEEKLSEPGNIARDLCRRRWSVGADGLVLIQHSAKGDYRMRMFNPDGSEAEMCGNALRCTAFYVNKRFGGGNEPVIEAGGFLKQTVVMPDGMIRVNMGRPIIESDQIPVHGSKRTILNEKIEAGGAHFTFAAVSMGNPHCVIFEGDIKEEETEFYGPLLEKHELFPRGTNVEFVKVNNPREIEVHVWERGAGQTLACGTGACAGVVAGVLKEKLDRRPVDVFLPGGKLRIQWEPGAEVFMEGPVAEVYSGEV